MVGLSNEEARKTIEHYNKTIFALECLVRVVTKAKSDSSTWNFDFWKTSFRDQLALDSYVVG